MPRAKRIGGLGFNEEVDSRLGCGHPGIGLFRRLGGLRSAVSLADLEPGEAPDGGVLPDTNRVWQTLTGQFALPHDGG